MRNRVASWLERLYRLSLWLYPPSFRRAHGDQMTRLFLDMARDARSSGGRLRFVFAALRDAVAGPRIAWRREAYELPPEATSRHRETSMTTWPHDLRLAVRRLLRQPAFTLVAVATMALGIGANTAIFSVVYGVLFRPLDLQEPERLAVMRLHRADVPADAMGFYPAHVPVLRERLVGRGFEGLTSYLWDSATLEGEAEAKELGSALMTDGSFFRLLGVEPLVGRVYGPDEVVPGRRGDVCVISETLWRSQFGADPDMAGRSIVLDGRPVTVIGVMPADVPLPETGVSVWLPQGWDVDDRTLYGRLSMMARLAPETSWQQAQGRLAATADELVAGHRRIAGYTIGSEPFQENLVGSARPALVALAGGVGLILLLACANLSSLLLARVSRQRQDVATRRALGAHWRHLASQQMTESVVLAVLGGGAGLALAAISHRLLTTLAAGLLPRLADVRLDLPVLLFALAASVITGLAVGLVPVLHAFATDLSTTLRGARSGAQDGHRTRGALVAVQVALAVALAVGAGLMVRTLAGLTAVDPGFDVAGVGAARVYLDDATYGEDPQQLAYFTSLLEALRARPGVAQAGGSSGLPFDPITIDYDLPYVLPGQTEDASRQAQFRVITPGYLETMGIPLRRGRPLADTDDGRGEPVALVNEAFVRVAWPDAASDSDADIAADLESVVGETFSIYGGRRSLRVVGVVGDVAFRGPSDVARPEFYLPHGQHPFSALTVVARSAGVGPEAAAAAARAIAEEALGIDRRQPVHSVFTLDGLGHQAVATPRFLALLLVSFAAVSLSLAAAGLYGLLAGWIADSRRELGLRLALGAAERDILALVLRRSLVATVAGLAAGLLVARLGAAFLVPFLFGVEAGDVGVQLLVAVVAVAAAVVVSLLPARRASRIEPSRVLAAD